MNSNNKYFAAFVLLLFAAALSVPSLDQQAISEVLSNPITWMLLLLVVFLLASISAVTKALESIKYYILKKEGRTEELEALEERQAEAADWASRFWKKLQNARPIEQEAEIELDHEYDGIRELDNNLPPWWLWGFYISIAFALVYLLRFHVLKTAPLSAGEYQEQIAEAEARKAEYLKNAADRVDETSVVLLSDPGLLKEGAVIFAKNCAVCHASDGGGGVGPNLTDEYWLHGGDIKDIFSTIKYGVPAKGMIPWKDQLNPSDMQKVASFIIELRGTTPASPKEAQGELYIPSQETGSDSTATEGEISSL